MRNKFERKLNFEVVTISEKAMSLTDAKRFAKENGGRLPDQVEAAEILCNVEYPELSSEKSFGYWCQFRPYYHIGTECGYGAFHAGYISSFTNGVEKMKNSRSGVVVVKDAE